jgi:ABC-type Fe3+/spermidine/putrescine transport system ATPase subunit
LSTPPSDGSALRLEAVTKLFGTTRAVDASTLEIKQGEIFTLLGPSGCGKTTTLRMVAGLERPDGGRIVYEDRVLADPARNVFVPPHRRNMGMVFQSYAIWPHMSVYENVAYPLRVRGVPESERRGRVERVLALVGLDGYAERQAPMLSGGQQQRVAISRALVYEPGLLLLDEPFSNLDAKLRNQMRVEVRLLQRRLGITVLFVTHDQIEALTLSDRIAVMNAGRVEQIGTPAELYDRPATPFVRDFLGQTVTIRGELVRSADGSIGISLATAAGTKTTLFGTDNSLDGAAAGSSAYASIRPEDIVVEPQSGQPPGAGNTIPATIETLLFAGERYEAQIGLPGGEPIPLLLPRTVGWAEGQSVVLRLPPERTRLWPA